MSLTTTTHINLRGNAREALDFYASVFGGQPFVMTHAQAYGTTDPAEVDLVAFGQVAAPSGFTVMAFDVPAARPYDRGTSSYFVSLQGSSPRGGHRGLGGAGRRGHRGAPHRPGRLGPALRDAHRPLRGHLGAQRSRSG